MKTLLLTLFTLTLSAMCFSQVIINEVDAQTPGADVDEFIELYANVPTSLDGYVLVLFNGSDDASYLAIDLDSYSITDGFFVIGNAAVSNVDLVLDDNFLQNGADAVALYTGNAEDFPEDTPVTTENIIDAVVYGTADGDDAGLLALLFNECQIQVDEDSNGEDDIQSSSRVPDGGTALCPDSFVQQAPSPGETNVPSCFGGSLLFADESTETELCTDSEVPPTLNFSNNGAIGDGTLYIVTDADDIIIFTSETTEIDGSTLEEGTCRIHAVSYNGTLDNETLSPGEDLTGVVTDGDCLSISSNYLTVTKLICNPDCDGATVSSDAGSEVTICLDDDADVVTFSNNTLAGDATYTYVVTDDANLIIAVLDGNSNDFNAAEAGVCHVWGLSYQGTLDMTSTEAGNPVFGIQTDGSCSNLSENYITVTRQECEPVEGCGNIFFSEYQEGSGNNKALEIYNPTQLPVSLSDYQLVNCSNGCSSLDEWEFTNDIFGDATIAPGDVFVIGHPDADPAIQAETDVEFQFLSNGDDVFALQRISTLEILDIIGEATLEDIGDGWTVSGVENGTQNHTLVRMETVNEGTADWSVNQDQWVVLDQDTFENLGSHTIIPCTVNDDTVISFMAAASNADEDAGTVTFEVSILNPLSEDMTVDVNLTGGTAISPDDFDGSVFPITLTFPAGEEMAQSFDITIVDDAMEEMAETIMLELSNASDGGELGTSAYTFTINESDVEIPVLDIVDAAEVDADGVAINLNLECELRAVVYGVNMRPTGLQFTIIDPTDGIGVFLFEGDLGYTVVEGDSVHVVGTIDQFNGLTQIAPTSVELISSGNTLKDPTVITEFSEATESDLITISCVEVVDPTQWVNDGSGFNVDVTDGTTTFAMRIDADTDVFGTSAPEGVFTLTGIGGQFDSNSPYDEGYQILPRYIADVPEGLTASYSFDEGASTGVTEQSEGYYDASPGSVAVFNADNSEADYTWNIDGTNYTGATVEIDVLDGWNGVPLTLTVTVTDGTCTAESQSDITFLWLGVEEFSKADLLVYPNPTSVQLTVDMPSNGIFRIVNGSGQELRKSEFINQGQQSIDVSDLATGVYFIEVITNDTVYKSQFVKK